MLSTENLLVLLLLLPGFLAARVFSWVAVRRQKTQLETLGEIVLFECLVLTLYAWVATAIPGLRLLRHTGDPSGEWALDAVQSNAPGLTTILLISLALGGMLGLAHNKDWLLTGLRELRVTKQSSHATVWQGAFYNQETWVIVHLESGVRILGWPVQFSDTPEEGAVFLQEAAYLDAEGRLNEIDGPGILLTKEAGIEMVEFLGPGRQSNDGQEESGTSAGRREPPPAAQEGDQGRQEPAPPAGDEADADESALPTEIGSSVKHHG